MRLLLFLLIVALPFVYKAQTGVQSTFTTTHDGKTREYILYIPQSYDGMNELPLLMNLHGLGSSMTEQIVYGEVRKIADTANFILVIPNGIKNSSNKRQWNYFDVNGEDDTGFLSSLIDHIINNYAINSDRVYFTGMSNGGFMSFYLACHLSNKITAVASVSGTMLPSTIANCSPNRPVPTMLIHGTSDLVVPYLGSPLFASVSSVISHWVNQTNCNATPVITSVPDIDITDGSTAEHHVYSGGTNGATVEHFKIIGGGHSWPGAPTYIDVTNHDFDANTEIWRFFNQYSTTGLVNVKEEIIDFVKVYPNPSRGEIRVFPKQQIGKLSILSAEGKIIHSVDNLTDELTVNDLVPGIYFVQVQTKEKSFSKKFVVN